MLATQVMVRVQQSFNIELPLRRFFESPTVADLALTILRLQAESTEHSDLERMLDELEMPSNGEGAIMSDPPE